MKSNFLQVKPDQLQVNLKLLTVFYDVWYSGFQSWNCQTWGDLSSRNPLKVNTGMTISLTILRASNSSENGITKKEGKNPSIQLIFFT